MSAFTFRPPGTFIGDVIGEHQCPACGERVAQVFRPGRARIYCTNACRQRAYRWRRRHGVRMCVERNGPAEQTINAKRHALRDHRDPASAIRDHRLRELTVCGTFAKPVREMRMTHHLFIPESGVACATCAALVGAGPFGSGIPEFVRQCWTPADQARMAPPGHGMPPNRLKAA